MSWAHVVRPQNRFHWLVPRPSAEQLHSSLTLVKQQLTAPVVEGPHRRDPLAESWRPATAMGSLAWKTSNVWHHPRELGPRPSRSIMRRRPYRPGCRHRLRSQRLLIRRRGLDQRSLLGGTTFRSRYPRSMVLTLPASTGNFHSSRGTTRRLGRGDLSGLPAGDPRRLTLAGEAGVSLAGEMSSNSPRCSAVLAKDTSAARPCVASETSGYCRYLARRRHDPHPSSKRNAIPNQRRLSPIDPKQVKSDRQDTPRLSWVWLHAHLLSGALVRRRRAGTVRFRRRR